VFDPHNRHFRSLRGRSHACQRKANPVSKTLVKVPKQEDLLPFKKMQLDTLVFAKGNKVADGLPDAGLPDNGRRSVYNMVDLGQQTAQVVAVVDPIQGC
jgi:hypothetical protein